MGLLLLTALAGGVGGAARFLLDAAITARSRAPIPLGTIFVNVTACLLLGLITGYSIAHTGSTDIRSIIGVGLLGGYSTFSTASVEAFMLLRLRRWSAALLHAGGMLAASLAASAVGLLLGARL